MDNDAPEAMDYWLNDNNSARRGVPAYEVREAPEVPRTIQAITKAFGSTPELNNKSLLLQTPYLSLQDVEKSNWNWTKIFSLPVSFALEAAGGEKLSMTSASSGFCVLQYWHDRQEVAMTVMVVTNHFLIGFEACFTGGNLYLRLWTGSKAHSSGGHGHFC